MAITTGGDPGDIYMHWMRMDGVRVCRAAGFLLLAYPDGRWSCTADGLGESARAGNQGAAEAAATEALRRLMARTVPPPTPAA